MTAQQLDAVKALAKRFNSDLDHTNVVTDAFGLPTGWVSVAVHAKGTKPGEGSVSTLQIVAGVSPEGSVHT